MIKARIRFFLTLLAALLREIARIAVIGFCAGKRALTPYLEKLYLHLKRENTSYGPWLQRMERFMLQSYEVVAPRISQAYLFWSQEIRPSIISGWRTVVDKSTVAVASIQVSQASSPMHVSSLKRTSHLNPFVHKMLPTRIRPSTLPNPATDICVSGQALSIDRRIFLLPCLLLLFCSTAIVLCNSQILTYAQPLWKSFIATKINNTPAGSKKPPSEIQARVFQLIGHRNSFDFKAARKFITNACKLPTQQAFARRLNRIVDEKAQTLAQESITASEIMIGQGKLALALNSLKKLNHNQLPKIQTQLRKWERNALRIFTRKSHNQNQHYRAILLLDKFLQEKHSANIDHDILKTEFHLLWLIHRELLSYTASNRYNRALQRAKFYRQRLKNRHVVLVVRKFQRHVEEERFFWRHLCRRLRQFAYSKRKCTLQYEAKSRIKTVRGKIIALPKIYQTGTFRIRIYNNYHRVLNINFLTWRTKKKLLKSTLTRKKIMAYGGVYLFSQGKIELAKVVLSKAGLAQKFLYKKKYY